ncbi:BatD family protein [Vibrio sp. ZSDE26]|uniref:BatD family protein n=1 Tax=Vibrio amylolyticus TaxID=2847292 RepID=A0A9X2BH90_9VIBR|nr:BatD family protein [Vibrio amylolyticus]MCK6263736.1 BatD family protein [Vibrio amylolyticus]
MQSILSRYSSIISLLTLLSVSTVSFVANGATTALTSVSTNQVAKNEVFQLRIVVNEKVSQDEIDFSILENDFYMSRPSFGTSINIINGDRNNRSEWNVSLAAQKLGTLTIPSFSIAGATTQPIQIEVSMDNDQPQASDLVELRSRLSTTSLYPKESARLDFRLIIKADPRRLQNAQIVQPKIDGMKIELDGEPNQYQTIKDGIEVTVVDQRYRIDAIQSGEFTLIAPAFTGTVIHGDTRRGTTTMINADTAPEQFTLTVHPKPENYSGAWLPTKQLQIEQQWLNQDGQLVNEDTPHAMQVGDALTRMITLKIDGLNPNQYPNLTIDYPETFRVYEEKPQFTHDQNGNTVMTLKQVLIPQQTGEHELSGVSINWWDSKNKKQTASTLNGLAISVSEATGVNNSQVITPQVPLPQTVNTVYDSGIWPYLTALFATLWLVSMAFIIRNRSVRGNNTDDDSNSTVGDSSTLERFKAALKTEDVIKSQFLLTQWLGEHTDLSDEESQVINQFKQKLSSAYSAQCPSPSAIESNNKLLKMMKRVERRKPSNQCPLGKL